MRDAGLSRDKQQHGPVTRATLGELAASEKLRPRDLVWTDGMLVWQPARKVEGLVPPEATTSPPEVPTQAARPTPPALGASLGTMFAIGGLAGLLVLAVSTFLPWVHGSGIGHREGKLVFVLAASAGAFVLAASLLKEHVPASYLAATVAGTLSVLLVIGEIASWAKLREFRGGPGQSSFGVFGLVVSMLVAFAVCGWFTFLAVRRPVEWKSLESRGLPATVWRHSSLVIAQLIAFIGGLLYVVD